MRFDFITETQPTSLADASGSAVAQGGTMDLPPSYFEQNGAALYLAGVQVPANGTVSVQVLGGSAFVYGAITDNRTNDARFRLFQPE